MGFDLAHYVSEQLKKGYSVDQIIVYLSKYGYTRQAIEAVINSKSTSNTVDQNFFSKVFSKFKSKKRPLNNQLVDYIQQNVANGYEISAISNSLKQYNYNSQDISNAVDYVAKHNSQVANQAGNQAVQTNQVKHTIDLSNKTIAFSFIIFISFIGIITGLYFILTDEDPGKLLDYELKLEKSELKPGEKLYFTNTIINMGTKRKYDIFIDYKISEFNTGTVIKTKSETIGVSTIIDTSARFIDLPSDIKTGKYRLESIATYDEDIATSHESFDVISDNVIESCVDGIKNQDEEGVDCGGSCSPCLGEESCYDGIKNQDEEEVDCGGKCKSCTLVSSCSDGIKNGDEAGIDCGGNCAVCKPVETCKDGILNQNEVEIDCGGICKSCDDTGIKPDNNQILSKVISNGNFNENESLRLCNIIDVERIQDDCFHEMSKIFNKSFYCDQLVSPSLTNICYMYFVQNGDYSVCEKINDVYIKKSCELSKQINLIMQQQNLTNSSYGG